MTRHEIRQVQEALLCIVRDARHGSDKQTHAAFTATLMKILAEAGAVSSALLDSRRRLRNEAREKLRRRNVRKTLHALAKSGGPR